jgi:hypothetical protein
VVRRLRGIFLILSINNQSSALKAVKRNVPQRLIFLFLSISRLEIPVLSNRDLVWFFGHRQNWEANFGDPVIHDVGDIDSRRFRNSLPEVDCTGVGIEVLLQVN